MMPPRLIVLLTLCSILAEIHLTSGYVLKHVEDEQPGPNPEAEKYGQCPPAIAGIRCISRNNGCGVCKWNEKCCFNGCTHLCMKVSSGKPSVSKPDTYIMPKKPVIYYPDIGDHIKPEYAIPDPLPPQPDLKPWDPFDAYRYDTPEDSYFPPFDGPYNGGYNFK